MKKIILSIVVIVVVFISIIFNGVSQKMLDKQIVATFEECTKAGYSIGESNPRQCFALGKTFVEGTDPIAVLPKADEVRPITSPSPALAECKIGGCSSQVCTDREGLITACEFRSEYACYKNVVCERQSNNECGWTMTDTLRECLANPN